MKKVIFLLASFALAGSLSAQAVKKYVLLEHFTNTKCPICASKNPAFYTLINQYPNEVRHLSIHPPVPYNSCVFYKSNESQNSGRANVYGIPGTPRVAMNGALQGGSSLLSASVLQSALNQTSPVYIQVTETNANPQKFVKIKVFTQDVVPAGSYKLYAAVAEKQVNYNAPNGEQAHHDVFRAMLPELNGTDYVPAAAGQAVEYNFTYTYTSPTGWTSNFDSLYVVAFVQNTTTKEVLNTGTRFDPVLVGTGEALKPQNVPVYPNPVQEAAFVTLPNDEAEQVELFSLSGQRVSAAFSLRNDGLVISTATLSPGVYFLKITGKKGLYTAKMVK